MTTTTKKIEWSVTDRTDGTVLAAGSSDSGYRAWTAAARTAYAVFARRNEADLELEATGSSATITTDNRPWTEDKSVEVLRALVDDVQAVTAGELAAAIADAPHPNG